MTIISTERLEEMRLLPCPFCGVSLVLTEQEQWVHPWDDVCPADDIHIHYRDEPRINAWNRRSLDKGEVVKPLVDYLWQEFCELPDRSSPEEYPDMAMVTLPELTAIIETYAERAALLPKATAPVVSEPVAWVGDYRKSDGTTDYFVMLGKGGREMSLHMHRIRGRAEYEAAEINHVLTGSSKPEFEDFDVDGPASPQPQPKAVTEEMVERAYEAFVAACEWSDWDEPEVRGYIRAALEAFVKGE